MLCCKMSLEFARSHGVVTVSTFLCIRKPFHEPRVYFTTLEETEGEIIAAAVQTTH
jgi:hypothetical protein